MNSRPEKSKRPFRSGDSILITGTGALASLFDIAGCYALMLVASGQLLTLNFSTDFLRLAVSDHLIARAKARRVGRTVGFVDVEVEDAKGNTVTAGKACYAIRPDIKQT